MGLLESIYPTLLFWKRKVARNLQDYGWRVLAGRVLEFAVKGVYSHSRYRLYRISLCAHTELPAEIDGIVFRVVRVTDRYAIQQIEKNSEWLHGTVHDRIEAGALCLGAFCEGELAGFNLVSFGTVYMPIVDVTRTFRESEAWSEQISTMPQFRKQGLAAQLRLRMFALLRARGVHKFYGGARTDNVASLKLARRVGFEEFAEIRYTRMLHMKRWRYVGIRK